MDKAQKLSNSEYLDTVHFPDALSVSEQDANYQVYADVLRC
jgi:hypothetical protein